MITASFSKNVKLFEASLTVKGHAGQAEVGKDIICSAASILTYTLAQVVRSNEYRLKERPVIDLEEGDAVISCKCADKWTFTKVLRAFEFAEIGYSLLKHNYPQFVDLKPFETE